ncbi:hypothetical protein ACJZ2D_016688 [Fusarium nematophilum]
MELHALLRLTDLFSSQGLVYRFFFCATHFLIGSLVFDLVHWLAHKSHQSPFHALRLLARTHSIHHQYFDRNLKYNDAVSRTSIVAWNLGRDSNHVSYSQLPRDPCFFLVGPQYHALHHIDPRNYFGSMTRFVDWVFGTAVTLRGRRVAMTGSRGALGQAFIDRLSLEHVKCIKPLRFGIDWTFDNYSGLESILANTDILILAHGSKDDSDAFQANCESVIAILELFRRSCPRSKLGLLPEVWYVGSEAEFHGCWSSSMQRYTDSKRAFVPFARAYYGDREFIYRHIVPAAFKSGLGPGLVTAHWTARVALWWIRRGARYVPVTYTGFAYANFFRFMFWIKPYNTGALGNPSWRTDSVL